MSKGICCWIVLFEVAVLTTASASAVSGTARGVLVVGQSDASCPIAGTMTLSGFSSGALGAYEPAGLNEGKAVDAIEDVIVSALNCGSSSAVFHVSGFLSDPGKSWLISIDCNGISRFGAKASNFYDDSTERANWAWSDPLGLKCGSCLSCK